MSTDTYLIRDDNQTMFELGSTRCGLYEVFLGLGRTPDGQMLRLAAEDAEPVASLMLDVILARHWQQPTDYDTFTRKLAARIVTWSGGQPIFLVNEHAPSYEDRSWARHYTVTDSRYETEWPYYDVFATVDAEVRRLVQCAGAWGLRREAPPEWQCFRLSGFRAAEAKGPAEVSEFFNALRALRPLPVCGQGALGCTLGNWPHDHVPGVAQGIICACPCHEPRGEGLFCSCFVPCCREPGRRHPVQVT